MDKTYISFEDIQKYKEEVRDHFAPLHREVINAFVYGLSQLSTADVEPVRRAEWRPYTEYYDDEYSECNTRKVYACSVCGRLEKYQEPYCNCGAKMGKVDC